MMNSKELIKKIDIGRVGNGTQTYNDMCLILNKEETLEHLQYVEQLEKENQKLKEELEEIKKVRDNYSDQLNYVWNIAKSLKNDLEELKKALDILKEKLEIELHKDDLCFPIPMISGSEIYQNLTQEEYELLKEVLDCEY